MQDKTQDVKQEVNQEEKENKCSFIKRAGKILLCVGLGACAFAGGKILYDKIVEDDIELE